MLFEWPQALLFVALDTAEVPREEIEPRLAAVQKALSERPFGEPRKLAAATSSAAEWLEGQAERFDARNFTREDAAVALRLICETAVEGTHDYDSARQLVWAFQAIHGELQPKAAGGVAVDARVPSEELGGVDPVVARLRPLEQMFIVDLRQGRDTPVVVTDKDRTILEVDLNRTLPPIADYDPKAFRAHFEELRRSLNAR
jgi:hypothetical protein